MKKQLKELLENSSNKLEKEVIEDILDCEYPEEYLKDLLNHGCVSGMVSSLIYYKDTKAFYIKYIDEIDELREECEEMIGEPLKMGYPLYNWLAWFGYEATARKIADKLDIEI